MKYAAEIFLRPTAFNLNLINVLNDRLDANFDLNKFKHKVIYNEVQQRIEMYLVSESSQTEI